MNESDIYWTLATAAQYGGSFYQALAQAGLKADASNKRRIIDAFPELIATYGTASRLQSAHVKTCKSCRYWQKWSKPGGECRRNAPQSVMIHADIDDAEHIAYWPGTDDADWCGEWEARS